MTELIRIMDGPIAMLACVSSNYYASCDECDEFNCRIKAVFIEVRDKTLEVLNNTTVASLSKEEHLLN
jgi:DNA-binding IscR family transcriptional regulator